MNHGGQYGYAGFGQLASTGPQLLPPYIPCGPIHATSPATGDPVSHLQLPPDVQAPSPQRVPSLAIAETERLLDFPETTLSAPIPPGTLDVFIQGLNQRWSAAPRGTELAAQERWIQQIEVDAVIPFGPQPRLSAWRSELAVALRHGYDLTDAQGQPLAHPTPLTTLRQYAASEAQLGHAPLESPEFQAALAEAQAIGWISRQVALLRGVTLERRLIETGRASDLAWRFTAERGDRVVQRPWQVPYTENCTGGWTSGMRTELAPPDVRVLQYQLGNHIMDLQRELQAKMIPLDKPPPRWPLVAVLLLGVGAAVALWTTRRGGGRWRRRRPPAQPSEAISVPMIPLNGTLTG